MRVCKQVAGNGEVDAGLDDKHGSMCNAPETSAGVCVWGGGVLSRTRAHASRQALARRCAASTGATAVACVRDGWAYLQQPMLAAVMRRVLLPMGRVESQGTVFKNHGHPPRSGLVGASPGMHRYLRGTTQGGAQQRAGRP